MIAIADDVRRVREDMQQTFSNRQLAINEGVVPLPEGLVRFPRCLVPACDGSLGNTNVVAVQQSMLGRPVQHDSQGRDDRARQHLHRDAARALPACGPFMQGLGNSAPASWTFGETWTHPATGALSPAGAADMSVYAKPTQTSLLHDEDRVIRFWEQPQASTNKFACGTWRATHGTLVIVDGSTPGQTPALPAAIRPRLGQVRRQS